MIPNYPDEKIIALIKDSPESREEVLELLFKNSDLRNKAFATISKLVKDQEVKIDIFTDSLLIFIKSIATNGFQRGSSLSTFLIGVCKKLCYRHLSKFKREKEAVEAYHKKLLEEFKSDNTKNLLFPDDRRRYEKRLTQRIYKQLSNTCREYFRNKYGQSMSIKDMAFVNNVKDQSVKNTLNRCRKKLRELIKNDPEVMVLIERNYGKV